MIIVFTNRKLPSAVSTKAGSINVTELGVILNQQQGNKPHIRSGVLSADYKRIALTRKGDEASVFANIKANDKYKPWVIFIHGFHQDPQENIAKARALYQNHQVNVIVFAWPSRPQNHELSMKDIRQLVAKDVLTASLGARTLGKIGSNFVYRALKDRWVNYQPAMDNAEKSKANLLETLKLVDQHLDTERPPVLLVHSMGNYVLQNVLSRRKQLDMKFSNIVLHQPDVNSQNHQWVEKLKASLTDIGKLYITTNATDYVLAASCIMRKLKRSRYTERLGQTRHHYIVDDINYLDFTGGEYVENKHELFIESRSKTNEEIFDLLGRLFSAKPDQLPRENNESHAGFSKMPSNINLYQLEYILDPLENEVMAEKVPSLKWFRDPLLVDNTASQHMDDYDADFHGQDDV